VSGADLFTNRRGGGRSFPSCSILLSSAAFPSIRRPRSIRDRRHPSRLKPLTAWPQLHICTDDSPACIHCIYIIILHRAGISLREPTAPDCQLFLLTAAGRNQHPFHPHPSSS